MRIKTITCHDVYNAGASLQAYALAEYLKSQTHEVEIIDYKPDYLSKHYSFTVVSNPKYDRFLLRQMYLITKFPSRYKEFRSGRKQRFDSFSKQYLKLTKRYESYEQLLEEPPEADCYIAGSDQIWNPLFRNGKDPAFFLQFVPEGKLRISYAASLAVSTINQEDKLRMKFWLKDFNAISVREKSGVTLLEQIGVRASQVCDPVFLLERNVWETFCTASSPAKGQIFLYDFDHNQVMEEIAKRLSEEKRCKIVSAFPSKIADSVINDMGPIEFLGAVKEADIILSNSFHATVFSLIFEKEFWVINRKEEINARMKDLLTEFGLTDRLLADVKSLHTAKPIQWEYIRDCIEHQRVKSIEFLKGSLTGIND